MSEQQADKQAWIWYDVDTLLLRHVSFNENHDHGPSMAKIQVHYQTALDVASGKSRLFEYELVEEDDELVLQYKKQKKPFTKFWQLIDPEKSRFDSLFDIATSNISPVTITRRDADGFFVDVSGKGKNIVFYITMRNDPNYLIKKIDLYPYAAERASTTDIKIPVDVKDDYSIYVRYDAA
jgi:hypothetical protein